MDRLPRYAHALPTLAKGLGVGVAVALLAGFTAARAGAPSLRLENQHYLVEVSSSNGVITRLLDKAGNLEIIQEPRLADNFRFTLPLRGDHAWQSTEANYILGREQRLTASHQTPGKLTLEWGPPLKSVLGKRYPVSAIMTLELAEAELRFAFRIRNRSKLEIGEVFYPILGGVLGLGKTAELRRNTELVVPETLAIRRVNLFHTFANMSWLGIFGPEQFYSYPDKISMPWFELRQPALNRSLYVGAHDPVPRYKVIHLEQSPGIAPGRADGNWPRPEELGSAPAGVKVCFVQFPYEPRGRDFEASPVVLRGHWQGWREGAGIYGAWLKQQQDSEAPQTNWLVQAGAFQECDAVPFKELPRWARAAAEAGVQGLVLRNWSAAGRGDAIPRFLPDSRLGTRGEFADAIRECHAAGVKVLVVVNLPPTSQLSAEFKAELHRYACRDRWGIPYTTLGVFEPSPLTGGLGAGERRVWLNPAHPTLRRALTEQIRGLAELGVDGIQVEEFFGTPLDFNREVGRAPDRSSWEGGLECLKALLEAGRAVRPGFALAADRVWDRLTALTPVCSAEARDLCALRTAVPAWQTTFAVADDEAFGAVNSAVRYRGKIRVAPSDNQPIGSGATRDILPYLRTVLTARTALHHTLLEGDFAADAAQVQGASAVSVFRHPSTGLRTAVMVNPRAAAIPVTFKGFTPDASRPAWLWAPAEGARAVAPPVEFSLPGRQLALITEEKAATGLPGLPQPPPAVTTQQLVFDFASAEDLEGWQLTGSAFSVSGVPGLFAKPTLNSLAAAGETATGSALSPPVVIEPGFEYAEVLVQGGWSESLNNRQNLALQFLDADTGAVLREVLPPGIHELRSQRVPLESLQGRTIRVKLVDDNRNSGYAWIGLRRLSFHRPPTPAQEP